MIRLIIDIVAIFAAVSVTTMAFHNVFLTVIAGVLVSAYGCWCYYDGMTGKLEKL